ncbi:DUF4111 domain-containing protein [Budviciaceae bacterium BWR-B9]|uniref:Aminoglycoside (3'') (9) adenylyltransferase n=1 Tax=Limnobaculum allomyrinae TaxID=2791986 RepID=A0ABS1ITF1_9GAMM|nr:MULTISPECIES: aminoglycoside adenylyltransferase family protein [Limnobaculum]MBK5144550.1 DUF4111 domain-containing protein [Limnobaculum allomyrinae]MBV7692221.1 DUF4111 domain-containing protein [Limnobaculum sp. M2-1]
MIKNIPDSARQQLESACALITQVLEHHLMAIHLYGSAVEGGLKPYSDIDLLVTVQAPLNTKQRQALMQGLLAISLPPGTSDACRALEVTVVQYSQLVPWQFPPTREMQFGEWLRDDILAGIYEPAQQDIDITILLTKVRNASVALTGENADTLFNPVPKHDLLQTFKHTLELWNEPKDLQGDERNIILTLARIWYSVVTENIIVKDQAADWLLPQLPAEHTAILQAARSEYLGLSSENWTRAMPAVERFVRYAKTQISAQLG